METSPGEWIGSVLGRPLRLVVVALCLATGLHVALEPRSLEPRQPWIAAEEGDLPGQGVGLERFLVTPADRAEEPVAWIGFAKAEGFVDTTLDSLANLADRINGLRRIATEARHASDAVREDASERFTSELTALQQWSAALVFEGSHPLSSDRPVVVETDDAGERAVRFELPRWDRNPFALPAAPLADPATTEHTLAALDRGYYRVVAAYREVAKLDAWLAARDADTAP